MQLWKRLDIIVLSLAQIITWAKNWEKNRKDDQLVKYKDIRMYLLLYIPSDHEE